MMRKVMSLRGTTLLLVGVLSTTALAGGAALGYPAAPRGQSSAAPSRLGIVWTSGDRDVALRMVFMYALNAKQAGWFDEVRIVVWGPSAQLLSEDTELQQSIREMINAEVEVVACRACADSYGVSDRLEELGIEVKYMGVELSDMLKGDWEMLTF